MATGSRTIKLELTNSKESYLPGSDASVTMKATWNGQPLQGAEIALVAADRGVLDLIDYRIPSPIDFFYNRGNYPGQGGPLRLARPAPRSGDMEKQGPARRG